MKKLDVVTKKQFYYAMGAYENLIGRGLPSAAFAEEHGNNLKTFVRVGKDEEFALRSFRYHDCWDRLLCMWIPDFVFAEDQKIIKEIVEDGIGHKQIFLVIGNIFDVKEYLSSIQDDEMFAIIREENIRRRLLNAIVDCGHTYTEIDNGYRVRCTEIIIADRFSLDFAKESKFCYEFDTIDFSGFRGNELVKTGILVDYTRFENSYVSTVLLPTDHDLGDGPTWFETMVLGDCYDGITYRYATHEQAIEGHKKACEMVEAKEKEKVG